MAASNVFAYTAIWRSAFSIQGTPQQKVYFAWLIFSIMLLGLYFTFINDRSHMIPLLTPSKRRTADWHLKA
jgi:hypothetical protein